MRKGVDRAIVHRDTDAAVEVVVWVGDREIPLQSETTRAKQQQSDTRGEAEPTSVASARAKGRAANAERNRGECRG